LVCLLFYIPQTGKLGDIDVSFLPHVNAILNTATSICLILGLIFIKNRLLEFHRMAMISAFIFSTLFLISYVIYHYQGTHTIFGDINHNGILDSGEAISITPIKYFYYFILITHIILAAVVVPFVLFALFYAFSNQISKHRKVVRYTYPIWLYVAVTGVLVYLLIRPYYL